MRLYFYRGHGIGAALIRFFSRSKYAHVSIAFSNGDVYEAVPFKGCIKTTLKSTEGVTPMMFKHGAVIDEGRVRAYLESELGTGYDWIGVLAFIIGIKPRNNLMFCSEYTFNGVKVGGPELQERTDGQLLRPDQLAMSPIIMIDYALDFIWKTAEARGR